jgi:hypothetical protein
VTPTGDERRRAGTGSYGPPWRRRRTLLFALGRPVYLIAVLATPLVAQAIDVVVVDDRRRLGYWSRYARARSVRRFGGKFQATGRAHRERPPAPSLRTLPVDVVLVPRPHGCRTSPWHAPTDVTAPDCASPLPWAISRRDVRLRRHRAAFIQPLLGRLP